MQCQQIQLKKLSEGFNDQAMCYHVNGDMYLLPCMVSYVFSSHKTYHYGV